MKTWVVMEGRDGSQTFWAWGELSDSPGFVNIYYTLPDGITMYSPRNVNEHGFPSVTGGLLFSAQVGVPLGEDMFEPVEGVVATFLGDPVDEVAGDVPVADPPPEVTER